ncbi:hypothetical protein C4588_06885 [Candidatus Parcubacteria bacterium]|nr:MAG: hypothetical protein C4588_06885 [Candidatus Parcubacteria bacterium]
MADLVHDLMKLLSDSTDSTNLESKIRSLLDRDKPRCNKCSAKIENLEHRSVTTVRINWGYESTGKDLDCDVFTLCEGCTTEFRREYYPICSSCRTPIPEVMAGLNARNPHCTFYGDAAAALKHSQDPRGHCGYEYAEIAGAILCEVCYEDFINTFEIPIPAGEYAIWEGTYLPGEGTQRVNRIELALKPRIEMQDSLAIHYSAWASWDEVIQIRQHPEKHSLFVRVNYADYDAEFVEHCRSKDPEYQKTVYAQTGDNQYYSIPICWLRAVADAQLKSTSFDPTKLAIIDMGRTLVFGELHVPAADIIKQLHFKNVRD